jgi:hypothetical protein
MGTKEWVTKKEVPAGWQVQVKLSSISELISKFGSKWSKFQTEGKRKLFTFVGAIE